MGEKSCSFSKIRENRKKNLSRWTLQKRSAELVSPTTYLGLTVLEGMRHLQPITAGNPKGLEWALLFSSSL